MKDLLKKSDVKKELLKTTITRIVAQEIMNLAEPCYYPALKKYFNDLFRLTGLTESDIRFYFKNFYKNTDAPTAELKKDIMNNLLIFIMYYYLNEKDISAYQNTMNLYMIRQYTNLMHRQISYCKTEVFKYTLDNLTKTNLFAREGTISSAIVYLAKEMTRRYKKNLTIGDPFACHAFIFESRTRLSQTIKSFATLYYKFSKEGVGFTSTELIGQDDKEYSLQIVERGQRIATDVSNHICMYKTINQIAINDAKKITRTSEVLAASIAKQLTETKYMEQIKLIVELFLKDLTSVDQICGPGFLIYVKNLMSIKRTSKIVYFKKEIIDLTETVMVDIDYFNKYQKLTKQTQFLISGFVAYYIAIVTRHLVCGNKKALRIVKFSFF